MRKGKLIFKRFGRSYVVMRIEPSRWLVAAVIAFLLFSAGAVAGTVYGLKKAYDNYTLREKVNALRAENSYLRATIREMTARLDTLYERQKVLAGYFGLPIYTSDLEDVGIGGSLKDPDVDKLKAYAEFEERLLRTVESKAFADEDRLRHLPSIPPVRGIKVSGFGIRKDPVTGGLEFHKGLDYAAQEGTPVVATADGVVEKAGRNNYGYGIQVVIDHGYGIKTRYAHLSKVLVKAGDTVRRGQVIGLVGNTGKSVGEHLHYEVIKNGEPVNPEGYILVRFSR